MFYYKRYLKRGDVDRMLLEREMQQEFINALDCDDKVKLILKELNENHSNISEIIKSRVHEHYTKKFEDTFKQIESNFNRGLKEINDLLEKQLKEKKEHLMQRMNIALNEIDENYGIEHIFDILLEDDNTEQSRALTEKRIDDFVYKDRTTSDQMIFENFILPYRDNFKEDLYDEARHRGLIVSNVLKSLSHEANKFIDNIKEHSLKKVDREREVLAFEKFRPDESERSIPRKKGK
jgi:hypothetical protein